ncbi:MAG: tripartite tricarboxylate transporter permease [Deltaproteobacteria bacterium]|nr:tripartite tricarboxylate transporter permease [Deltaproteobacteria bacterium]
MLHNISAGFFVAFQLLTILTSALGVMFGIIVGAIPGLSATMGVALLVPLTFVMEPAQGLLMLMGIFCGAVYGGSISAILFRVPGTGAAVMTMLDGNEMTKKGESQKALQASVWASFAGGVMSAFALMFFAPALAVIALKFGPSEYFALALCGLTIICTLESSNLIKGFISGLFGLLVGTMGLDPMTGYPRFTFGRADLFEGVQLIPALIGLFSLPEVLSIVTRRGSVKMISGAEMTHKGLTRGEIRRTAPLLVKTGLLGVFIGVLPGAGGVISSIISYSEAKRSAKRPELFGTGIIEGVIAPEAANNGSSAASLVPMLTLGIPGSATAAIFLGALTIHGLRPGPLLFHSNSSVVFGLLVGTFYVQVIMLILGLFGARLFARLVQIPGAFIAPSIALFSIVGSYAMGTNIFDVWIMFIFGIIGTLIKRYGFSSPALLLALVLGPILEENMAASLQISGGSLWIFISRPLTLLIYAATIFLIIGTLRHLKKQRLSS